MTTEKTLLEKIASIKQEIGKISKEKVNPHFRKSYFDINQIMDVLKPLEEKYKVLITQPLGTTIDGKPSLKTEIYDLESDTSFSWSVPLTDNVDPQKMGSAITYFRRYSLVSFFGIEAEDDDGNGATENKKTKSVPSVTPPPGPGLPQKEFAGIRDGYANDKLKPTPEQYELMDATQRKTINDLKLIKRKEHAKA